MKIRRTLFAVTLAIVFMFVFAMDVSAGRPGFDDKEIRIAQWGPQTGPGAPWGSVARGSGILFNLVNEEGGIHGRKIKYYVRDDQYNPSQTKAVVKELVERKGVFAFVGGTGSACGMAVKDYLKKNNVIWVGPATSINEYVFPPQKYLFVNYPLYRDEASIVTKYLVEKMGFKKIGFFYQNDSYGKNGLVGCKHRLDALGMELVAEIPVEQGEKDLASQMLKFKNSGAEAVLLWGNPATAVISLKTCATIGYKPQWVFSSTLSDYPLMYKISGGLWEGAITSAFGLPPDSNTPLMVKYHEAQKRMAPEERWGTFYFAGIIFAEPLVEALKRVGPNLSTEACLKELNALKDFQGIGPVVNFSEDCHQGTDSVQIQKCGPGASYILLQDWTPNDLATWKK